MSRLLSKNYRLISVHSMWEWCWFQRHFIHEDKKTEYINYYSWSHTGIGLLPRLQADSLSNTFSSCDVGLPRSWGKGKDKDGGKDGGKDRGKGRVSCQVTYWKFFEACWVYPRLLGTSDPNNLSVSKCEIAEKDGDRLRRCELLNFCLSIEEMKQQTTWHFLTPIIN